jgi:phosphoribosylglycinamide formyltransferase-1
MNVGVLASHEGTTLQSLLDAFAGGRIPGRVSVVVSNNGDSGALVKAREAGVQAVHLSSRTHRDPATLDAAIRDALVAAAVDVVFLAGYMKKLGPLVLGTFQESILNTHPALLPRFGGRGMYGDRVFEAVLEAGESPQVTFVSPQGLVNFALEPTAFNDRALIEPWIYSLSATLARARRARLLHVLELLGWPILWRDSVRREAGPASARQ